MFVYLKYYFFISPQFRLSVVNTIFSSLVHLDRRVRVCHQAHRARPGPEGRQPGQEEHRFLRNQRRSRKGKTFEERSVSRNGEGPQAITQFYSYNLSNKTTKSLKKFILHEKDRKTNV